MSEQNNLPESKIKEVFLEAIGKVKENDMLTLSDLYVSVGFDDLALSVYDDEEGLLAQANIDEWSELKQDPDTMEDNIVEALRGVLNDEEVRNRLEALDVIRPFSVVLVDEDFDQKEELLRLDDNLVVLEDDFLKSLDQELDDFLKNLLKDV